MLTVVINALVHQEEMVTVITCLKEQGQGLFKRKQKGKTKKLDSCFIHPCISFDRTLWETNSCLTTLIQKCYREPQYNKPWGQLVAVVTKYGVKSDDYLRGRVDDTWTWLMDRVEDKTDRVAERLLEE